MRTVRILKYWNWLDIRRQTPGCTGMWGDTRFVVDVPGDADYVCVLDHVGTELLVKCPRENAWLVLQEPPNELSRPMHKGAPFYGRIFHQDLAQQSPRHVLSHGALSWHVNRSYDELVSMKPPPKFKQVSWITSNSVATEGHRKRMYFLEDLRDTIAFDLFGKGFCPIEDKWEALAPYRYSIAVENFASPWYWSEKIVDPLLAWCMPIYCGCSEIERFVPSEALFRFDADDKDAPARIRQFLMEDPWEKRIDAIAEARHRLLNEHQLFPFLHNRMINAERESAGAGAPKWIPLYHPLWGKGGGRRQVRRAVRLMLAPIKSALGLDPFGGRNFIPLVSNKSPHSGL